MPFMVHHGITIFLDQQGVAITGDGSNGPGFEVADIGFAMSITGAQITKDAADFIRLDNFTSVVTAAKWGRNVFIASRIMGTIRYAPIAEAFSSELPSSASDALGKFCHIEVQILGDRHGNAVTGVIAHATALQH